MTITLPGEVPSKKNSRINTRTGRSFPSKQYQTWHSQSLLVLRGLPPVDAAQVEIHITFIHGTLRRRDSDNGTSSVLDLLVDAGILPDDNWRIVRRIVIDNEYKKNEPVCVIEIKEKK